MSAGRKAIDLGVAALAVALVVAGAVAVFVVKNGTGAASLVGAGTVLLALVLLRERIDTLRWGDLELSLRRQADVAEAVGDRELARELVVAADGLRRRAAPVADSYEAIRRSMAKSDARTAALEAQMEQARAAARTGEFDGEEIEDLFRTGTEGERIYALAVLLEHPDLASSNLVLDGVRDSRSRFEQYYSLVLADLVEPRLAPEQKRTLQKVLRDQTDSGLVPADGDRGRVATRILRRLE